MKKIFNIMVLTALLMVAPSLCFAEMLITRVSRPQAKELGLEIRATANGPKEVWVELEFKPDGKLKDFNHVSLEIRDGDRFLLGYAPLKERQPRSGTVTVGFLANRAYLDKVTLSVVVGQPMDYSGYELRVKDFLEQEKIR